MSRFTLAVVLGLCVAGRAAAGAESMFDELAKNFGSVPRGPTLSHPFRLTNNSGQTVHIAGVRVSCGCTSASALQTQLAPGESTAIQAQMDTRRFYGPKSVTIYVTFDRPQYEEIRLQVSANARDDIVVTPEGFAFGSIRKGSSPSKSLTITLLGSTQWQVLEIERETNYITASAKEVKREGSEVQFEITAGIRNDTPEGKWFTDLWVKTTHPSAPRVRLPITVEIEPAISLSQTKVELGQVKAGAEAEKKIFLRGGQPFQVSKIEGTDAEVKVTSNANGKQSVHVLTIHVKPNKAGDLSRKIKIITDLKDSGELEFETTAKVVQ